MRFFKTRSALVMGVIALAVGIGAGAIFASQQTGAALAQGGETELDGVIEVLPTSGTVGNWQVSGRTVIVTDGTEIDTEGQALAPGLRVEIEGYSQPDGTIVAEEIEVTEADDDDGGPSASQDDDDGGPAVPPAPGAPAASDDDDDDGGPTASQGDDDDGGPSIPNATQASDDDD